MKLPSWIFYGFALLQSFFLSAFALAEDHVQKIQIEQPSSISDLPSSNDASTSTSHFNLPVRASEYADFLNHVTTSDPDFLDDEKMGSDSQAGCIRRSGVAGSYHYEVIAGRENEPIAFVSQNDAEAYSRWLGKETIIDCTAEGKKKSTLNPSLFTLHSSRFTLYSTFIENGSCTLSLALSSISHLPSSNYVNSRWAEAFGIVGMFCLAGVAHELMMRFGDGDSASEEDDLFDTGSAQSRLSSRSSASGMTTASMMGENNYDFQLSHFIETALEEPAAQRLIIDHDDTEMIVPKKSSLASLMLSKSQKKNRAMTLSFKKALREEYGGEFVSKLLPGQKATFYPPLGSSTIFKCINSIETRITNDLQKNRDSDIDRLQSHVTRKQLLLEKMQQFYEKHQALLDGKNLEKTFLGKTAHNVNAVHDIGGDYDVKFFGCTVPIGLPLKIVATTADSLNRKIEKSAMKEAKRILEAAHDDLIIIQRRIDALQKKQEMKRKKVSFEGKKEAGSAPSDQICSIDEEENNQPIATTFKVTPTHQRSWNKAVRLEKEANVLYERAVTSNTSDDWLECMSFAREAKKAWEKAIEAKETALALVTEARERNYLFADISTAENKIADWNKVLKEARANYHHSLQVSSFSEEEQAILSQIEQLKAEAAEHDKKGDQSTIKKASDSWYKVGFCKNNSIEELKAAYRSGDTPGRSAWKRSVNERLQAAKEFKKAAEAYEIGTTEKISEADELILIALDHLKKALHCYRAIQMEKATEAESLSYSEIAIIWKNGLAANEEAEEHYVRSANFYRLKQNENGDNSFYAADGAYWASMYFIRMAEAVRLKKQDEAAAWDRAAREMLRRVEFNCKAIKARAVEKKEEVTSWDQAEYAAKCASTYLVKAIEAEALGTEAKRVEAFEWRKASEFQRLCYENHSRAAAAWSQGKENEAESWDQVGFGADWASVYLVKAIEVEAIGTEAKQAEATEWRKASEFERLRCENKTKAAEAWSEGKEDEAKSWDQAGLASCWVSGYLAKAIEAEVIGTEAKRVEAFEWRKASEFQRLCYENHSRAAAAWKQDNNSEAISWGWAGNAVEYASNCLAKAIEAELIGIEAKQAEANEWRGIAEFQRLRSENAIKGAVAWKQCNDNEATIWDQAEYAAYWASEYLVKAIEAENIGNNAEADKKKEQAILYREAVEELRKAAEEYAKGKNGDDWRKSAKKKMQKAEDL